MRCSSRGILLREMCGLKQRVKILRVYCGSVRRVVDSYNKLTDWYCWSSNNGQPTCVLKYWSECCKNCYTGTYSTHKDLEPAFLHFSSRGKPWNLVFFRPLGKIPENVKMSAWIPSVMSVSLFSPFFSVCRSGMRLWFSFVVLYDVIVSAVDD